MFTLLIYKPNILVVKYPKFAQQIANFQRYHCTMKTFKKIEYSHTYTPFHLSSFPHNASPTLATPLNGFVTSRTTAFPGQLDIPIASESVFSATSFESFTAWIGAATNDPTAATGTQRGDVTIVNTFRIVLLSSFSAILVSF